MGAGGIQGLVVPCGFVAARAFGLVQSGAMRPLGPRFRGGDVLGRGGDVLVGGGDVLGRVPSGYEPKSSNLMFSGSTPRLSSVESTAAIIGGGPHR